MKNFTYSAGENDEKKRKNIEKRKNEKKKKYESESKPKKCKKNYKHNHLMIPSFAMKRVVFSLCFEK